MSRQPEKIGKYHIKGMLGKGSMAVVYHAIDPFMKRDVALKVAHLHLADDSEEGSQFRKLFFNEARAAGILNHPHILKIFDADIDDDLCYLVMEYISESHTLDYCCKPDSLLPITDAVRIIYQSAKALDYAHRQGIIHRDIKPSNILMNREAQIKLADFSIAIMTADSHLRATQPSGFAGSPLYMSPEQINEGPIENNTDIYSLGLVMYQLLTGQHPFTAKNISAVCIKILHEEHKPLREINDRIPVELDEIISRMLEKDAGKRYQSASSLVSDLAEIYDGFDKADTLNQAHKHFKYIQQLSFFEEFTPAELWDLISVCPFEKYPKGEVVVREGGYEKSVFILVSGIAHVNKRDRRLGVIMEGDCFGEMAYFSDIERTATVIAQTDILVMKVDAESIRAARAETQLRFNNAFLRTVIARLADASSKLVKLKETFTTEYSPFDPN